MTSLSFAKHRPNQPIEQINGLIGQIGGEVERDGDQCRMPPLTLVSAICCTVDGWHRGRVGQRGPDARDGRVPDQGRSRAHVAGVRSIPASRRASPLPASGAARSANFDWCSSRRPATHRVAAAGQRLALPSTGAEPLAVPGARLDAESFKPLRAWNDDAALPALLHDQSRQVGKLVILNRMWQQPTGQLSGRPSAEGTQAGAGLAAPRRDACGFAQN